MGYETGQKLIENLQDEHQKILQKIRDARVHEIRSDQGIQLFVDADILLREHYEKERCSCV